MKGLGVAAVAAICAALTACTNNPYPDADETEKVRYRALPAPLKTLDPAVSYTSLEHKITANVYETLLEYHYLKRPYTLMPALAEAVPEPRTLSDGRVAYTFRLRPGMRFQDDPAFALGEAGRTTREILASDIAFELSRIADPDVASPVFATFAKIDGFRAFSEQLKQRRESDPDFAAQRIDRQYAAIGGISGVRTPSAHELEIILSERYPQILYWFAMPFTTPVPWEAIAYYDGQEGRDFFKDHPISVGPFQIAEYRRRSLIVLTRNPNWYGALHPQWRAPGTVYPSEGEAEDVERGRLDADLVGKPLPFLDRIEFRLEKETIPAFNKFIQGYYDASGIIQESFDKVVLEGGLSPDMAKRGMLLEKSVDPTISYIGFNMRDPVVGAVAGERGRKLRQAMSSVIDVEEYTRIFNNGRGVAAQSPLPPGIYGYDPEYRNPFRVTDVERAKSLLAEAGYPGGVDPATGKPLHLSFDLGDTSARGRVRYLYFVNAWNQLGIDVEIVATNYNKFREKMREGAYQVFMWGWIADYPDPENFLFLLWGPMAREGGGVNSANFDDPRYNALFLEMKDMPNGPARAERIRAMRSILERERPWIELTHSENFALYHGWMKNVKPAGLSLPAAKYEDIDQVLRAELRSEWNRPVVWPAYALAAIALAIAVPGVVTFFRERQ